MDVLSLHLSAIRPEDKQLSAVTGDVFDPASVDQAVKGQDAVICALGVGNDLKKTTVRITGTVNIISSMQEHYVDRLLVITALGVGESWDTLSLINRLFFATLLKSARDDHETQETAVKESGLDWKKYRFHDLRHTAAALMLNNGVDVLVASRRLGYAKPSITLDVYGHLLNTAHNEVANKIEKLIF